MNESSDFGPALEQRARALINWYSERARVFLEPHAPELIAQLDNDRVRLARLLNRPRGIVACFLGHSGIGKSTLLNALASGSGQVLPAGGTGPLTAQATEVHFSEQPSFSVNYHLRHLVLRLVFALEQRLSALF